MYTCESLTHILFSALTPSGPGIARVRAAGLSTSPTRAALIELLALGSGLHSCGDFWTRL